MYWLTHEQTLSIANRVQFQKKKKKSLFSINVIKVELLSQSLGLPQSNMMRRRQVVHINIRLNKPNMRIGLQNRGWCIELVGNHWCLKVHNGCECVECNVLNFRNKCNCCAESQKRCRHCLIKRIMSRTLFPAHILANMHTGLRRRVIRLPMGRPFLNDTVLLLLKISGNDTSSKWY